MQSAVIPRVKTGKARPNSFSLIELLTVMAIIGILSAITLQAVSGIMANAARSRARSEERQMETGMAGYNTDNGGYPIAATMSTNQYSAFDGSGTSTNYTYSAQVLYMAMTGKTNYLDVPIAGAKSYATFKLNQLGNSSAVAGTAAPNSTYVQDPWSDAYGYSTGTSGTPPYNGTGFFDLWSTAGLMTTSANSAITNRTAWIANWQQ